MVAAPRHNRVVMSLLLAVLVGFALTMSGCLSPEGRDPSDGGAIDMNRPGVYQLSAGKTRVVGTVVYRDLEGGFWAIAGTDLLAEADMADTLAILIPSEGGAVPQAQFAEFEGELVAAEGLMSDGPSIYMAGPLIEVETIVLVGDSE